jgi:hypothetical protein
MGAPSKYDFDVETLQKLLEDNDWCVAQAAKAVGMPPSTLDSTIDRLGLREACREGRKKEITIKTIEKTKEDFDAQFWQKKAQDAEKEIHYLKRLRTEAFKLQNANLEMPEWAVKRHQRSADIPVLFTSDFQWGEVIDAGEMDGFNKFNIAIARNRYRQLIGSTIDICENYRQQTRYPGIVYLRGGDSVSGDIHDELQRTNEAPSTMQVMSLFKEERRGIELLQQAFGKVVVISVPGNHGRLTKKPIAKKYAEWNFDHMLSLMLEASCQSKDVTFITPMSGDAYFTLYGIRFLLTHGDRIGSRGGTGFIGPIATITRGAKKTRDAYATAGKLIDWILIGHFHTSAMGTGFIANGALPGYGEYAQAIRATPEPPCQTLFFVNKKYGLNEYRRIVLTDETRPDSQWFDV